jgi:gamma-glutamylaminecyclotransferase
MEKQYPTTKLLERSTKGLWDSTKKNNSKTIQIDRKNMSKKHLIAVYGTLKKGFGNHRLLVNSKFIGSYVTESKHVMINHGIPEASPKWDIGKQLSVELYEVNDKVLEDLDSLEGSPDWYYRYPVKLIGYDGIVEMYVSRVFESDRMPLSKLKTYKWHSEFTQDNRYETYKEMI